MAPRSVVATGSSTPTAINQAIGMLLLRFGVSADEGFKLLRTFTTQQRQTLDLLLLGAHVEDQPGA